MIIVFHLILILLNRGVYSDRLSVSVMEGDFVTLLSGTERKPQEDVIWYFNNSLIAKVENGDLSDICTDVLCHEGAETFRGRLKLDLKTGSLTIMDTRSSDTGDYQLLLNKHGERIFGITVYYNPAANGDKVKKNEGDSVYFNPGLRKLNDVMSWFFNSILIANITGNQSQVCTDDRCKERFSDRLKLDNENGSLTIMNITTTDSGNYTLEIITSYKDFGFKREKIYTVTVISRPPSGLSAGAVAAIVIVCLLLAGVAVAGVILWIRKGSYILAARNENNSPAPNDMSLE